jgi:phosphohistidine phosphatase
MTNELLLMRHAKSDWSVDTNDFSRPLKKRGKRAAKQVGQWLYQKRLIPDIVLSSPAVRASETARKVCRQLGIAESAIVFDPHLYEADTHTLLTILKSIGHKQRVLLIGHNPGLEQLLLTLVPHSVPLSANGKHLPTAALAHLAIESDWTELAEDAATLITLIHPDNLSV